MTVIKPTFSQLIGRKYEPSVTLIEWFSKEFDGAYRRESVVTILAHKVILNKWVDAMESLGRTSDAQAVIEESIHELHPE